MRREGYHDSSHEDRHADIEQGHRRREKQSSKLRARGWHTSIASCSSRLSAIFLPLIQVLFSLEVVTGPDSYMGESGRNESAKCQNLPNNV